MFASCPRCIGGQIIDGQCLQCSHEVEIIQTPVQRAQAYIDKARLEQQEQIKIEIKNLRAMLVVIDRRIAVYTPRKHPRLAMKQYEQRKLIEAKIVLLEADL